MNKVKLWGQLKYLTGEEFINIQGASNVDELIFKLAEEKKEIAEFLIVDDQVSPSILVFINDVQHIWGTEQELNDGQSVTIMTPIAGG